MNINVIFVTVVLLTAFLSFLYGMSKDKHYWPAWWCVLVLAMGANGYLLDSLLHDTSLVGRSSAEWVLGIVFGTLGLLLIIVLAYKTGVVQLGLNELKSTAKKVPLSPEDQELFDKAQELAKRFIKAVDDTGASLTHHMVFGNRVYIATSRGLDNKFIVIGNGFVGSTYAPIYHPIEGFMRVDVAHAIRVLELMLEEMEQK